MSHSSNFLELGKIQQGQDIFHQNDTCTPKETVWADLGAVGAECCVLVEAVQQNVAPNLFWGEVAV